MIEVFSHIHGYPFSKKGISHGEISQIIKQFHSKDSTIRPKL